MEFRKYAGQFRVLSQIVKRSLKVGAVVVVGVVVYSKWQTCHSHRLHAAWTTGYEPSVKWDTNWDRRDPHSLVAPHKGVGEGDGEYQKQLKAHTPTASRHILLIRHGQYFDNAPVDKERFLTSLGRAQAELTGQRLKELDLPYTVLISSTMARALETAEIIHKYMPDIEHITDDSLREGAPIPPEPPIGSWRPEMKQFFQDGARIESAFRKYFYRADPSQKEDSYEVVVCHANVIRYFICRALQFPGEAWLRICVANCSLSLLTVQPDGLVVLEMMGDHGHIQPERISFH